MTNEERQRTMEFILQTQAQLTVNDEKHDKRLDRLERIARLMVRAGLREKHTRNSSDERLTKALAELAESQKYTAGKLDALVDIVRQQQNGRLS
jgi:hypothetical protein